jgi:FtsH-binding integral membrane protein
MPLAMQGSPILIVLALAPLPMMVFWLWRNRRNSLEIALAFVADLPGRR